MKKTLIIIVLVVAFFTAIFVPHFVHCQRLDDVTFHKLAKFSDERQITPDDWFDLGERCYRLGDLESAVIAYNQAIKTYKIIGSNKDVADVHFNRALTLQKLWEETRITEYIAMAIKDFDKVIELDPGFPYAWSCRGLLYKRLGMKKKAESDLSVARSLMDKIKQHESK